MKRIYSGTSKSWGRVLLPAILFFCLVLCFPSLTKAASKVYKIKTAKDWHKIGAKKGGTFKIMKDIKLSKPSQYLMIEKNKSYTIDLNGHKIYTGYKGSSIRELPPLGIKKGTVVVKDSTAKKKGKIMSTEMAAVVCIGGKFCLKSGTIETKFKGSADQSCAIGAYANGKLYISGGTVKGSLHGIMIFGSASIKVSGIKSKAPKILGVSGSGLAISGTGVSAVIRGGNYGTKVPPNTSDGNYYIYSGYYPIFDESGSVLRLPSDIYFEDASGSTGGVALGVGGFRCVATISKAANGYYMVYARKR